MVEFNKVSYNRFINLIRKSYKKPQLFELLQRAKPGEIMKYEDLEKAGAEINNFRQLDRYLIEAKNGFYFTEIGKNTFESQLIVDKKGKVRGL